MGKERASLCQERAEEIPPLRCEANELLPCGRRNGLCASQKRRREDALSYKGMCQTACTAAADAQSRFLPVACAIAKHNAMIRMRFPMSDPFYQKVEACFFGAFWDMPLQLLIFLDAAETTCGLTIEQHETFAQQLKQEIASARCCGDKPERERQGEIKWKKTLPFAIRALPDEIEREARAFFASVYSLHGVDRASLLSHEKAFWARHKRLRQFQKKARRDKEDLYRVLLMLRRRVPDALCGRVLQMAL